MHTHTHSYVPTYVNVYICFFLKFIIILMMMFYFVKLIKCNKKNEKRKGTNKASHSFENSYLDFFTSSI